MKKKTKIIICGFLSILICSLLYMVFIRDWQIAVDADSEINAMRKVTYFDEKRLDDLMETLKKINAQSGNPNATGIDDLDVVKDDFRRCSLLLSAGDSVDSKPYLKIEYLFGNVMGDSTVEVFIFTKSNFKYSLLNNVPKIDLPDEETSFSVCYDKFSPILKMLTKHKDEGRFEYFVSPLITGKDYFFWPSTWGGDLYLVFIYGDYTIYIEETSNVDVKDYKHRYKNVIADLAEVFKQAEAAE